MLPVTYDDVRPIVSSSRDTLTARLAGCEPQRPAEPDFAAVPTVQSRTAKVGCSPARAARR